MVTVHSARIGIGHKPVRGDRKVSTQLGAPRRSRSHGNARAFRLIAATGNGIGIGEGKHSLCRNALDGKGGNRSRIVRDRLFQPNENTDKKEPAGSCGRSPGLPWPTQGASAQQAAKKPERVGAMALGETNDNIDNYTAGDFRRQVVVETIQ